MEYSLVTVVETRSFRKKAERLLSEIQILELIVYLSANPGAGVLIKRTAGIRKLRWATSGRGKSGGVRVIYYFLNRDMPLYLLEDQWEPEILFILIHGQFKKLR